MQPLALPDCWDTQFDSKNPRSAPSMLIRLANFQRITLVDGPYCWRHSESGIFMSGGSPREGETLAMPGAPGSVFGKDGTLNQSRCSMDVPWMSTIRYYASHRGESGTSACLEGSKP